MPTPLGVLSERYALEERIADGGMATVYRARDEVLARPVAVKVLHPHLAEDASFLERFRREALAAARLTHPNIVSIYDTGSDGTPEGERHFIVMEFCGGGTLQELVASEGPLDGDRVRTIGTAICDALSYAHANGVVHRDVKPGNVLLADDGTVKVSDFGIAKAAFTGRDLTTSGSLLGTVTYISPEQARGDEPDERSDIYSLGVVLYELITGRPPFAGDTAIATAMQHVKTPPPPPRSIRAGVPRDVEIAVLGALQKDRSDRPASAEELKQRLTTGGDAAQTSVMRTVPRSAPASRPQSHGDASWVARVLLLVAVVVAIAVAGTWVLSSDDEPNSDGGERRGGSAAATIEIADAIDFDPHGTGGEHPTETQLAHDGNDATSWTTENYQDPFEVLGKTGVGLVLDLGDSSDVQEIEVVTNTPGMAVQVGTADELADDETGFTVVDETDSMEATQTFEAGAGASGRYWLIWITQLPGGSGSGAISEVTFVGS